MNIKKVGRTSLPLDVSSWKPGLYIAVISTPAGNTTKKIIIR
ncbi:MAG: T9SS type A sorting domain-containing protein [Bacteroidales bacterium]|nr:T9SS type A sorting domain-containing protein [Bacteroidales bacterium]